MKVDTNLLKDEMNKQNLNITDLSEKSGVDKSTVSRLLNGRQCSIETAQRITAALKLSPMKAGIIFFANKVA